jgi:uncharacterized membrane protein
MWGPAILAMGLGVFVSRKYYLRMYRELEKQTLALLLFGLVAISAGVAQISYHNYWETLPEIVISLLGWALLLKGFIISIVPGVVDRVGDWEATLKLIPFAGAFMLIVGVYLSWVGYFM